jgi:choline oxidase
MIDAGEFDCVIAGGGTAGCVVAARLPEDPSMLKEDARKGAEQLAPPAAV